MTGSIKILRQKIIQNWKIYRRTYSWRKSHAPYKIMIAEFMLQRTKADQVELVYINFLRKYPDIHQLSLAKYKDISKFIAHLGLPDRSKYFTDAARYIVKNYSGKFPRNRKKLLQIPGVGDYVAGAILTVCYNKKEYVIDINIARVINRYFGLNLVGEIRRKAIIIEKAQILFTHTNTRKLLFAILDFAALICKSKKPRCYRCILRKTCKYFKRLKDNEEEGTSYNPPVK